MDFNESRSLQHCAFSWFSQESLGVRGLADGGVAHSRASYYIHESAFFGNETILRSATRCNLLPAHGLETLSNIHLTQALLFLSLALTLALVLAGDLEKIL
jgi:hypothetical protein